MRGNHPFDLEIDRQQSLHYHHWRNHLHRQSYQRYHETFINRLNIEILFVLDKWTLDSDLCLQYRDFITLQLRKQWSLLPSHRQPMSKRCTRRIDDHNPLQEDHLLRLLIEGLDRVLTVVWIIISQLVHELPEIHSHLNWRVDIEDKVQTSHREIIHIIELRNLKVSSIWYLPAILLSLRLHYYLYRLNSMIDILRPILSIQGVMSVIWRWQLGKHYRHLVHQSINLNPPYIELLTAIDYRASEQVSFRRYSLIEPRTANT